MYEFGRHRTPAEVRCSIGPKGGRGSEYRSKAGEQTDLQIQIPLWPSSISGSGSTPQRQLETELHY